MKNFKLTFWKVLLILLLAIGAVATFIRFYYGLGASTNLSDSFPWGLWIGFDVMCGVMLAAGGFTLTATVYIFNQKRFRPIVRPTVLTAFLGYSLVVAAIIFDLGRGYNIWHPLVMWNPRSVMFEVGWCVTLYTTVLFMEFLPVIFEKFRMEKLLRIQHAIVIPLVICGVLLSTLHQSSLGSLYLIMPNKLHPFWYTPLLPVFFFISAIAVGLAMTIFESSLSAKYFGKQLEASLILSLGRTLLVVLLVYSVLRLQDLLHRGVFALIGRGGYEVGMFLLEVTLALIIPITLLFIPKVRNNPKGLYLVSVSVVLGFVTNRMNVAITGMESVAGLRYFPKWTEIAITLAFVAFGFMVFALAVKYLPIFESAEEPETQSSKRPFVPRPEEGKVPELSHARP